MAATIHHNVAKRARRENISLSVEMDGEFIAFDGTTKEQLASHLSAKTCLDMALAERQRRAIGPVDPTAPNAEAKLPATMGSRRKEAKVEAKAKREDENGQPTKGGPKSIVKPSFREVYAMHSDTCGDVVAVIMAELLNWDNGRLDIDGMVALANNNGIDLHGRWGHLNLGQQRMNLGNVLRGKVKRNESVTWRARGFEVRVDDNGEVDAPSLERLRKSRNK